MPMQQAGQVQAADDDFDGAFAQATAKSPAAGAQAGEDNGNDAAQAASEGGEASAPAPAPAAQAPAPSPAPAPQAGAPAQQPPKGTRSVEDLERLLADALQRERSVAGRISANDQRINALQRENADLKRQLAAAQAASKPAPTAKPRQNIDDVLTASPDLEQAVIRRVDAATAELRTALEAANAKLAEVGETAVEAANAVKPVVQQQADDAVARVQGELDTMFTPAWRTEIRSNDFGLWLREQDPDIQRLYFNSTTAKASASVLDLYYATKGGRPKPAASNDPQGGQGQPGNTQPRSTSQDRLREAAGIQPRPAARVSTNQDDFEGAFAEATTKLRANARK